MILLPDDVVRVTARIEAGAYVRKSDLRRYAQTMRQYRYERLELARLAVAAKDHPKAGFTNPLEVSAVQELAKSVLDGTL